MALDFNKYAAEANTDMAELSQKLGTPYDHAKTSRILRSVIRSMRDVIPIEESFHVIAQLPMFLKAVYVDGWNIKERKKRIKDFDEFLYLVKENEKRGFDEDFVDEWISYRTISVVLNFLKSYISAGEVDDVKSTLTPGVRWLWESHIQEL